MIRGKSLPSEHNMDFKEWSETTHKVRLGKGYYHGLKCLLTKNVGNFLAATKV